MGIYDEIFIKEMSSIDAYNYGRQVAEKKLNVIHEAECNKIRTDTIDDFVKCFTDIDTCEFATFTLCLIKEKAKELKER